MWRRRLSDFRTSVSLEMLCDTYDQAVSRNGRWDVQVTHDTSHGKLFKASLSRTCLSLCCAYTFMSEGGNSRQPTAGEVDVNMLTLDREVTDCCIISSSNDLSSAHDESTHSAHPPLLQKRTYFFKRWRNSNLSMFPPPLLPVPCSVHTKRSSPIDVVLPSLALRLLPHPPTNRTPILVS